MPPFGYFGIESSGLNLAVDLLILFVVVLYLALIYWTYTDARRRIVDPMLVGCATAASFFPFVGTVIYMILRPPEYLEDVHERELEIQAAEARVHALETSLCPHCDYRIERDFIRCPSCLRKLKERCQSCGKPLERTWTICPYCEADVPGLKSSRSAARGARGRRRKATLADETLAGDAMSVEGGEIVDVGAVEGAAIETAALDAALDAAPLDPEPVTSEEAAPVAATEAARRPRSTGRASRPGGRSRPASS
jgi:hypothetical protein